MVKAFLLENNLVLPSPLILAGSKILSGNPILTETREGTGHCSLLAAQWPGGPPLRWDT